MKIQPGSSIRETPKYTPKKKEHDVCVICGVLTEYETCAHIDSRLHYVEGAGQLCGGCYKDVYGWWTM